MSKQFYETRKLFIDYTGYDHSLTYDEWVNSDSGSKAALLYIQYFDQILTAWYKLSSSYPYMDVDESIETVLQYLEKNISRIEESPKKYTAQYIYRVVYNCLYCISHDRVTDRYRYFHESSNVVQQDDGDELDLFDLVSNDKNEVESSYDDDPVRKYFWETIEDSGKDSLSVVMDLLTGMTLDGEKISSQKKEDVIKNLQDSLGIYLQYYNNGKQWRSEEC